MDNNEKPKELRLAMLGMVDGNGHPYSWSAIFNGYDKEAMASCPFPGIPAYLNKQPADTFGIPGARVTHVWTDDDQAAAVSRASLVPNIVDAPEDVIGQVDAVLVATDIGSEHVERCRPFVEAGIPIFVDKPLVDNEKDLQTFVSWVDAGATIMSSSSMRYTKEYWPLRTSTHDLGQVRYASITTPKSWERYGIHALEGIYPILGPGFVSAQNTGEAGRDIVHFKHENGADVNVAAISDMYGGFGMLQVCGTAGSRQVASGDSYYAFKKQLEAFVGYLQTGVRPFPFEETIELMKMVIAGIRSREEGGRVVLLSEISERAV
jgi:predicted dehydrogenase